MVKLELTKRKLSPPGELELMSIPTDYVFGDIFDQYELRCEHEGVLAWSAYVELRDDMYYVNEKDVGAHKNFISFDGVSYNRKFVETLEDSCKHLVNTAIALVAANKADIAELKFSGNVPKDVCDYIRDYTVPGTKCILSGPQWFQIKIIEPTQLDLSLVYPK